MSNWGKGLAALLAVGICSSAVSAQTLTVGSKNFVEQYVVAELYAGALEGAGYRVSRKINLGPAPIVHQALRTGVIDLYPEYTGTALAVIMNAKGPADNDPQKVYDTVQSYYEREFKLTWLKPSRVDNGYAIIVRRDTAEALNLRTLSDLARAAPRLTIGMPPEFDDRRDGLAGLREVYGIEFKDHRPFPAMRLRYKALESRQVDVVVGFATDGQMATADYVVLGDDKTLFPPYVLAPVMRIDVAKSNPGAVEALERVGAVMDNPTLRELNRKVAVFQREPREVAAAFLKAKGIGPRQ